MTQDIKEYLVTEALRVVTGARRNTYGKPERNFHRIALMWQAWLDANGYIIAKKDQLSDYNQDNLDASEVRIDASWVPPFMRLMKEARLVETPDHLDSFLDIIGYAQCGAEVEDVQVPQDTAETEKAAALEKLRPYVEEHFSGKIAEMQSVIDELRTALIDRDVSLTQAQLRVAELELSTSQLFPAP